VESVRRLAAIAFGALVAMGCGDQPSVEYEGPYADDVRGAIVKIERITGTPFKAPPRVATRTRAELRAIFEREFEDKQGQVLPHQESAMRLLGLVPQSMDLRTLLLDLLVEQVMGFYLPADSTLYLVDDAPAMAREFLITHELVHALQAQYVNLDSIQRIEGNDDRQLAAQSMLEGQAQFVAMRGLGQFSSMEQMRTAIRRGQSEMPEFASAPLFVQEMMIFPYLSGAEFVRQFLDSMPGESLYDPTAIPTSTEQILHWSRYAGDRDAPIHVTLPAPRAGTAVYDNNMGEFGTRLLLFIQSNTPALASSGAEGWAGDRYVLIRTPRGDGIAWLTIWDTTVEAAEFGTAMRLAIDRRYYEPRASSLPGGATGFEAESRSLRLWGGDINGRAAVLYVDMPKGERTDVVDVAGVELGTRN
jgi:hypothetical protein